MVAVDVTATRDRVDQMQVQCRFLRSRLSVQIRRRSQAGPDRRLSSAPATPAATSAPASTPAPTPMPTAAATPPLRFGRRHGRNHHAAGDDDSADGIHAEQDAGRHQPRHHVADGAACFAFCHLESPCTLPLRAAERTLRPRPSCCLCNKDHVSNLIRSSQRFQPGCHVRFRSQSPHGSAFDGLFDAHGNLKSSGPLVCLAQPACVRWA